MRMSIQNHHAGEDVMKVEVRLSLESADVRSMLNVLGRF